MIRTPLSHSLVVAFMLLSVGSAGAKDSVLDSIPDSAYLVAYFRQLDQASEKIARVTRLVGIEDPNLLELAKQSSGLQQGLEGTGQFAVALLPGVDAVPSPVLFVPTNDYAALVKQFKPSDPTAKIVEVEIRDRQILVGNKGGFAVMVRADQRSLIEDVLASRKPIRGRIESLFEFLESGDACVIVTQGGIEVGMQRALRGLEGIKAQLAAAGQQGETAAMGLAVYESLFEAIRKNVTQLAVVARIEEDGSVRIASNLMTIPAAGFPQWARKAQGPAPHWLADLPPGPFVVAAGGTTAGISSDSMIRWSLSMLRNLSESGKFSEQKLNKLVEAGKQAMEGVQSMSFAMNVGEADEPLYGRMYLVIRTDNAGTYLNRYQKMVEEMRELTKDGSVPFYRDMQVERIEVNQTRGLKISMSMAPFLGTEDARVKETLSKMFGGDQMQIYLAAADEKTVVGAYVSQEQLLKILKAARASSPDLSADKSIATTASQQPKDAHWIAYLSPTGLIAFVKQAMSLLAPVDIVPQFPDFPASPPIGFTVKITNDGLKTDLLVPADTLRAGGQFAGQLRQRFGGRD